jgi:alpha-mannosidase
LSDVVRDWNERYAYPRIYIATAGEFFREFEKQYGDRIPSASGDFTPYWEDGAASSAAETALTRDTDERLTQAEALWAMLKPEVKCPRETFDSAWVNAIMYNEHTWGAHNSISQPDEDFVKQQWAIKQAFALNAAATADVLLQSAAGKRFATGTCTACCASAAPPAPTKLEAVLVHNTNSWPRTGLVTIHAQWPRAGDRVVNDAGGTEFSQRLSTGELVFMAKDVPAFGSRKYYIHAGEANQAGSAQAAGNTVANGLLTVVVNVTTGAIESIACNKTGRQIVNPELGLNQYWYVPGKDPEDAVTTTGQPTVAVKENGPLVASLAVESGAPGCRKLTREIRLVSGIDRVEIINIVDKEKIRTKEGVHFAFDFAVPDGVMRMDTPWAVVRPESDQLPGSCKNWFTVQRWVDVSNQDNGVTWATVDAPLVEVGAITAETPWMTTIEPSQRLYSYVMNNYWHTNYKADQEGPTVFRYGIWPHGRFDSAASARFGVEASQPLVVAPAPPEGAVMPPLLRIEPAGVMATGLKISQDGKDFIVRLFGASGKPETARLSWRGDTQPKMWLSDLSEKPGASIDGSVDVPAWGMVTVRIDGKGERVGTKDGGI